MGVLGELLRELASMFFGAPRLALPLLILVAIVAAVAGAGWPEIAGAILVFGCLALLGENVFNEARARKHSKR